MSRLVGAKQHLKCSKVVFSNERHIWEPKNELVLAIFLFVYFLADDRLCFNGSVPIIRLFDIINFRPRLHSASVL